MGKVIDTIDSTWRNMRRIAMTDTWGKHYNSDAFRALWQSRGWPGKWKSRHRGSYYLTWKTTKEHEDVWLMGDR